jgi:hypothetical protein
MGDRVAICPPLIINETELADLFGRLHQALDAAMAELRAEGHFKGWSKGNMAEAPYGTSQCIAAAPFARKATHVGEALSWGRRPDRRLLAIREDGAGRRWMSQPTAKQPDNRHTRCRIQKVLKGYKI